MLPSSQRRSRPAHILLLALMIAGASGCNRDSKSGDSVDRSHDHDHHGEVLDSNGRLIMSEAGQPRAHVVDLDTGSRIATFDTQAITTALYPSPGQRYAVLIQRDNDVVEFLDGGLWREDHGDHLHDYQEAPALLGLSLSDRRPTHYEMHDGQAALFFDGSATPFLPAKISLLTDSSLGSGSDEAALNFSVNMHGTAEPRSNFLLTTYRDPAASSTLPQAVELYERQGVGYSFVERFSEPCPELHGSFSNRNFTLFGCSDGVLVIEQTDTAFSARKIANPPSMPTATRVGTLAGHEAMDTFIAIAGQLIYIVDPVAGTLTPLDWTGGANVTRIAHAVDRNGNRLLVLDSSGRLSVFSTADQSLQGSVPLIDQFQNGNNPVISISQADDFAYITDPAENAIQTVNLETLAVSTLPLDFTPAKLAWVGIPKEQAR